MRHPRFVRPVVALTVAAGLSGCGAGGPVAGTDADVAHVPYSGRDGADGGLEGTLQRQSGCTTIATADGTVWVPVFPNDGVKWRGEELDLTSTSAAQLLAREGDVIRVGGGEGDPPDNAAIPKACETHTNYWFVTPR